MNPYSQYIEIFYYNRWQNIVNNLKYFTMRHFTYIYHSLSRFKLLIVDDIHYYSSCIQNVFPTFIYDSTHAWDGNSVSYIMKFLLTSSIFLMGGLSNSTFFKMLYSSWWLLYTSRDTQPLYIITSCNVPPSTFFVFECVIIFSSSPFS